MRNFLIRGFDPLNDVATMAGRCCRSPGKKPAACGGGARIVIHPERDDWARQLTALRQQMAEQAASLDASGEFPWRNIDHLRAGAG
ncbi:butyryl-CoA dehydrogenase [Klebsiella pneumoniae]|uniref:Butyryl-CoA dehydrogenase n=1 Tax=Klebsiella pneumoniae TaxID=573 RepID=A0A378A4E3_KLEPN|nr:butyryl-CoA dehydrogenase [Klebsiella pneumoniae]